MPSRIGRPDRMDTIMNPFHRITSHLHAKTWLLRAFFARFRWNHRDAQRRLRPLRFRAATPADFSFCEQLHVMNEAFGIPSQHRRTYYEVLRRGEVTTLIAEDNGQRVGTCWPPRRGQATTCNRTTARWAFSPDLRRDSSNITDPRGCVAGCGLTLSGSALSGSPPFPVPRPSHPCPRNLAADSNALARFARGSTLP